jgi:hypothetical protein
MTTLYSRQAKATKERKNSLIVSRASAAEEEKSPYILDDEKQKKHGQDHR